MPADKQNDDPIKKYIAYWDDIVKKWFSAREIALAGKRIRDISDIDDPFDSEKRKTRDELRAVMHRELDEVDPFLKTLKDKVEIDPLLMPEPYWGDPSPGKHSFVIADYNPGGSMEDQPRRRGLRKWQLHRTALRRFENRVETSGYAAFAKFAPIMMSEDALKAKGWSDFKDYGGRKWWTERRSWAERIAGDSGVLPFGMEFCGWHSNNWPLDKAKCLSGVPEFDELVLKPFLKAVETSTCKLGLFEVADGSRTGDILHFADRDDPATHDPIKIRDVDDPDRDHDVPHALPQHSIDRHGEDHGREGPQGVHNSGDHRVQLPLFVPRKQAEDRSADKCDRNGTAGNDQGDPRAVNDSGKGVPTHIVCSEQVVPGRSLELLPRTDRRGVQLPKHVSE